MENIEEREEIAPLVPPAGLLPPPIGLLPLSPSRDTQSAMMAEILAATRRTAAESRADNQALIARLQEQGALIANLQRELSAGWDHGVGLRAYGSVHDLPLRHSRSALDAYTLKNLPANVADLKAAPSPLLSTGDNKFVKAIEKRMRYRTVADTKSVQVQDGITIALAKEITPLLTLEAIGELSADVHRALADAAGEDVDPSDFFAAVETAAYLSSWSQKLVAARIGEIAALLQYDQGTAQRWAAQVYGPQNTLMGDSPIAAAFQLVEAATPKPAAAAVTPPAWAKNTFKASGGRGRGRAGGRGGLHTPTVEQVTRPGAAAPGRAQ